MPPGQHMGLSLYLRLYHEVVLGLEVIPNLIHNLLHIPLRNLCHHPPQVVDPRDLVDDRPQESRDRFLHNPADLGPVEGRCRASRLRL